MSADTKWIKPSQAAKQIGISKATMYRQLSRLASEGVEILKPSERVTLIDRKGLEEWLTRQRLQGNLSVGEHSHEQ